MQSRSVTIFMVVVLDCNIWISLTINSQLNFIANLADRGITIASCSTLRHEIVNVLSRPKLNRFISEGYTSKVVELHDLVTVQYNIDRIENVVTDAKDNYLFALCIESNANYLVTGDKIILDVHQYRETNIINLSAFKRIAY